MEKRYTKKELQEHRKEHEAWLRENCSDDVTEEAIQADLDTMEAMEASYTVATLSCECGRVHEIEFTPPEYNQGFAGNFCACGNKVHFEDTDA
jgi:hypothetical protein